MAGDTRSADFPTTSGAHDNTYNGNGDMYVARLNASGSQFTYASYFGASGFESPGGMAMDASGNIYVVGWTNSPDFPTTPGAYDTTYNWDGVPGPDPSRDVFIVKIALPAAPSLKLRIEQEGFPSLTVDDNGPGDLSPLAGVIVFSGPYGSSHVFHAVGLSKPFVGSAPAPPELHLSALVTSVAGGTLLMTLADSTFTHPDNPLTLNSLATGTLSGTGGAITLNAWANADNVSPLDSPTTMIPAGSAAVPLGTFTRGAFQNGAAMPFARIPGMAYAVFQQARITLSGGLAGFGVFSSVSPP